MIWHAEAMARQKKMPKLKELSYEAPKKRQTPEQMEAVVRSWLSGRRSDLKRGGNKKPKQHQER
jgi:hypothetical protein